MLSYILATIVGLGSVAFYMAAFFFPEVYRKGDFIWSGIGFFYALVLWFCAGQIGGAVLLGQTASVAIVAWLGWQTLKLRRETTPLAEQTSTAALAENGILPTAIAEKITTIFPSGNPTATPPAPVPAPQVATETPAVFSDGVTQAGETATEPVTTDGIEGSIPTPSPEQSDELPAAEIVDASGDGISPVLEEPEIGVKMTPISPLTDFTENPGVGQPVVEDDFDDSNPVPFPPPTKPVAPKSRTFGFLAGLVDRVQGLLNKGKPQPANPSPTIPPSRPPVRQPSPSPETIESIEGETRTFPETVETAMTQAIDILDSAEALAEALEAETNRNSPDLESIGSQEEETVDSAPTVEIVVAQPPEAVESVQAIQVPEDTQVETSQSSPPVEIVVSQQISIVTSDVETDTAVEVEGETGQSSPTVEIIVSQEIQTLEGSDAADASAGEAVTSVRVEDAIPSNLDASAGEDEAPSSEQTRPTSQP